MSIVLKTFCYFFLQISILVSILFLLRGHNHPGGGFIAALVSCTGLGFYILSYKQPPDFIKHKQVIIIIAGIVCLISSLLCGLLYEYSFLTGLWWKTNFFGQQLKIGTPLLFDVGIYLSILGSLLWILVTIEKVAND